MEHLVYIVITGTVATAATDVWGTARKLVLGIAPPDYALVGRWLGHMPHGCFRHDPISKAASIKGERLLGWGTHYLIGIAYAALLFAIGGEQWRQHPTLLPALMVGIATVAAPFLLMQPGMGAGIAASRTPRPWSARLQSVIMHLVFGVGLYAGGCWSARLLG